MYKRQTIALPIPSAPPVINTLLLEGDDFEVIGVHEADSDVYKRQVSTKRTVDPSAFVLDMGQNLAGFPEIKVRGKRGQKVTLIVAEALRCV